MKKIKSIAFIAAIFSVSSSAYNDPLITISEDSFNTYLHEASLRYNNSAQATKNDLTLVFSEYDGSGKEDHRNKVRDIYQGIDKSNYDQKALIDSLDRESENAREGRTYLFNNHSAKLRNALNDITSDRNDRSERLIASGKNNYYQHISGLQDKNYRMKLELHKIVDDFSASVSDLTAQAVSATIKANNFDLSGGLDCKFNCSVFNKTPPDEVAQPVPLPTNKY
jgi:hypothetical protein